MDQILQADPSLTEDGSDAIKSESLKSYLPLKRNTFDDEKDFTRFVKSCERLIRSSPEYRDFITFARESLNADVCSLTGEDFDSTGDVELHHYPLNLFEITRAVIDEFIYNDESFSSFDVANKVMELHFQLKVGFVPLIGTLHKKFHKGNLQIPIEYTMGDYKFMIENFHIDPELANKVEIAERLTIENTPALEWGPKFVNKQVQYEDTGNHTENITSLLNEEETVEIQNVNLQEPQQIQEESKSDDTQKFESDLGLKTSIDLQSILED